MWVSSWARHTYLFRPGLLLGIHALVMNALWQHTHLISLAMSCWLGRLWVLSTAWRHLRFLKLWCVSRATYIFLQCFRIFTHMCFSSCIHLLSIILCILIWISIRSEWAFSCLEIILLNSWQNWPITWVLLSTVIGRIYRIKIHLIGLVSFISRYLSTVYFDKLR